MKPMNPAGPSSIRIGDLRVDPALDEIRKNGHTIKVEPKAMQLLTCLAARPGDVVSVEELLDLVWKDVVVSHDSVYAAMAALRKVLGDDPKNPTYIANVVRRGYRLIAPVTPWEGAPANPNAIANVEPASNKPSIAVMPFLNSSGDPAQVYLSDGITEDIITGLSRWRRLAVRSRSASFRYGGAVDTKQVARELGVRFVVEGSVRRLGDRVRISAQLIDAESGSQIWSERFDRGADEIFAVQDRVVQTIVSTLVGRVEASDTERARRKPPTSLMAYECVLKCNALSWHDPAGLAEAARLAQMAIELDPSYAVAHALLAALSYSQWDDSRSSAAALEKAYALATRAVELDDGESTCHAILGHICLQRRAFDLAVQYSRRAIEINPNNQWNTADLASILIYVGESEEALVLLSRAREIDSYFDPPWSWRAAGLACMNLHRYADALSQLSRARVRAFHYTALIAGCHGQLGDSDRTAASVVECLSLRPDFSTTQFVQKEPFKNPTDREHLASVLRLAGLPD
jgi:TolB-like protein